MGKKFISAPSPTSPTFYTQNITLDTEAEQFPIVQKVTLEGNQEQYVIYENQKDEIQTQFCDPSCSPSSGSSSESDPIFRASPAYNITQEEIDSWNTPVTSLPIATTSVLGGIKVGTRLSITLDGVLSANAETDPIFVASAAHSITNTNITNWDTAYSWGNWNGHNHYQLYQPNGINPFVYTDNSGQLHIDGNIIQLGSSYETHAEQLYTTKDYIILREGATAGLTNGEYAGFMATLYDGINNGHLVFDNTGTARVGDVGNEQPLTTRIETPTNTHIAIWDSTNYRLDFIPQSSFISSGALNNYVPYSGANNYLDLGIFGLYAGGVTVTNDYGLQVGTGTTVGYVLTAFDNTGIATWQPATVGTVINGTGFVKASGTTVSYDDSTYLTSVTAHNLLSSTHGDTLVASVVRGDIIYGNSTPKWARLAKGTTGQILVAGATDISWSTVNLLSATHADTLAGTVTRGAIIYGNSTPKWAVLAIGTNGKVLTSNGTDISWQTPTTGVPYTGATGPVDLGAYDLTVQGFKFGLGGGNQSTNLVVGIGLTSNTTGIYNVALGNAVLTSNQGGYANLGIGSYSLTGNVSGHDNVGIGYNALNVANSNFNTAIGSNSLAYLTSGTYNVAIGHQAGQYYTGGSPQLNQTSSYSVYIGTNTRAYANADSNEIVIGSDTTGYGSNTATWGNTNITDHYFSGTIRVAGFKLGTSSTVGYVLTTDASGVGTWQAATGGGSSWVTTPTTKTSTGTAGQIAYDANYYYICVATNQWVRTTMATNW